jgi:hypothetical protein
MCSTFLLLHRTEEEIDRMNMIGGMKSRLNRSRLSAIVCLYLMVAQLPAACAFQQRPRRTTGAGADARPSAGTTGAESWKATVSDLALFPSPEVEFIVGPQLKSGSPLNPAPWFDSNAIAKGVEHGAAFPAEPPGNTPLMGTLTVAQGSASIVGSGTKFIAELPGPVGEYNFFITDASGLKRVYYIASIQDDTHLTLTVPYREASGGGRAYSAVTAAVLDAYINLNYYDQGLVQYVNYYRTGDARFLTYARKIADSWWKTTAIAEGHANVEESFAPRNASLAGLMLRALDGRPEMWPWITEYVRTQFQTWVGARVTYPGFYYGIRDPGYMLLHAANLARVHPDPVIRQEFKDKALAAALNYYVRLQGADGGFYLNLDDIANTTQPFQVGILAEGLIAVHRLTGDERLKRVILKSAEHQFTRAYNPNGWRGMYYFVGGAFTNGHSCEAGCGAASNPFPPKDTNLILEARQLNSTAIHHFGYAYLISGDAKYRRWGDEIFDATYGGGDGYRGLGAFRAKEYDEAYRSAGKYLAWRLSHGETQSAVPRPAAASERPGPMLVEAAGISATPSGLVAAALAEALKLSSGGVPSEAQLQALLAQIEDARKTFTDEQNLFQTPAEALGELKAAYDHTRNALLIIKSPNGSGEDAKLRLGWAAARLKRAGERIRPRAGQ